MVQYAAIQFYTLNLSLFPLKNQNASGTLSRNKHFDMNKLKTVQRKSVKIFALST